MYRAARIFMLGMLALAGLPGWTAAAGEADSAGAAAAATGTGYGPGAGGTTGGFGADDDDDTTMPPLRPQPPRPPPPPPPPPKRCVILPEADRTCGSGWRNYEACYVNGVLVSEVPKACVPARGSLVTPP
jgi:hypothetical protein